VQKVPVFLLFRPTAGGDHEQWSGPEGRGSGRYRTANLAEKAGDGPSLLSWAQRPDDANQRCINLVNLT